MLEQWIEEYKAGNEKVFKLILNEFMGFINLTYNKVMHVHEYEDFIQESAINIMDAINTYETGRGTTIRTHIMNCLNFYKYGSQRKMVTRNTRHFKNYGIIQASRLNEVGADGLQRIEHLKSDSYNLTDSLEDMLENKKLRMSDRQKDVLIMHFQENKTYSVIAQKYGVSKQRIEQEKRAGIIKLKKVYKI